MLADLHRRLTALHRAAPAAAVPRDHCRGVHWVNPSSSARSPTATGRLTGLAGSRLRHPSWRRLRPDKDPRSVMLPVDWPPLRLGAAHRWRALCQRLLSGRGCGVWSMDKGITTVAVE
jgi:hypothetical protein